jgi:hypothetical protein
MPVLMNISNRPKENLYAAKVGCRRKPTKIGCLINYEDHLFPDKGGLMFPTYFHKNRGPVFVMQQSEPKIINQRRVSR